MGARILAAFVFAVLLGDQVFAQQRAVQSPLVVNVVRGKTDSGRRTNYDTGYSSSKEYNRSVQLRITTRNMSTNTVEVRQEALFVAEAIGSSGVDGIYSRCDTNLQLTARSATEFIAESAPLGGYEYKSSYGYNYKQGSKFKGYVIRTFANGQLVDVQGSQPSLQKIGWDEKAIRKMLPKDAPGAAPQPAQPGRAPAPGDAP